MQDRSALGPADVTDEQLQVMVAELLGTPAHATSVLDCVVEPVEYSQPSITTAGRYWVRGTAESEDYLMPFELFVKHVQSWTRSPMFDLVPPEFQPSAAASVPWRTEPLVYRSDLRTRLPDGLRMPRALGVFDLDELSASMWLEVIHTATATAWDTACYARAAYLLGRLAGSASVRELAKVGAHDFGVRDYLTGRLELQVLRMLRDPRVWEHPLVAGSFDHELRARLEDAADRAADLTEELVAFPMMTSHGDACPNNLLLPAHGDGFVLIDFGFWTLQPVGFDLAQLLVGDAQLGLSSASGLAELEGVILPAYLEGLGAEGHELPLATVRRAHAVQLLLFTGLSALPVELLDEPITDGLVALARERATITRFSLDLLDATA